MRQVGNKDITISSEEGPDSPAFVLGKGEYVTMPHDLHMRDPKYFRSPEAFEPERFLVPSDNGELVAEIGSIRPYGGGPSMCKGRVFAERECMAFVAGILMFWDIEPVNKSVGFVIPKQKRTTAVSLPVHDTRVRIKRRRFEWDG
jgi:cytochrome P450